MKYWYDTEFVELGPDYPISLVSIGIVAEDGREYYAQVKSGLRPALQHEWVRKNVVPHLQHLTWVEPDDTQPGQLTVCGHPSGDSSCVWKTLEQLAEEIEAFMSPETYGKPELWAYYADYDHVVFAQIFGTMIDLPEGFPMYTLDIKQLAHMLGNPKLPEQGKDEHFALADARWNRTAWEFLQEYRDGR